MGRAGWQVFRFFAKSVKMHICAFYIIMREGNGEKGKVKREREKLISRAADDSNFSEIKQSL